MKIRKIIGVVAWFSLAAGLVLFNAAAASAMETEETAARETVCAPYAIP